MQEPHDAVIIGAGPAGLTAARELVELGLRPLVIEAADKPGGLSRTETYRGYRFDIGGHRFYTKAEEILRIWRDTIGEDFLEVSRLSRILFNGRFFDYPLSLGNVIRNLGVAESARIMTSFARAQLWPHLREDTLEHWVVNRFGERLYRTFFKTYTEKVWGIPCSQIGAEWAAQRLVGLSLVAAVQEAVWPNRRVKSLIKEFNYPKLGPGQMWERVSADVERRGGRVLLRAEAVKIHHNGNRVTGVSYRETDGVRRIIAPFMITSMSLDDLIERFTPQPPASVSAAARGLRYRDFIIVTLIVRAVGLFPDNWIYLHSPSVRASRVQCFNNWSPAMVPEPDTTTLGMEYFCTRGDDIWQRTDEELMTLARREVQELGLARSADVVDGCVIRQPKAYPIYDGEHTGHVEIIRRWLGNLTNLETIGRNGMHRYNNQDHSMLCGLYAARNVAGANHDLWGINTDRSYFEKTTVDRSPKHGS
jgi:protoporphyrinogen oxidase